MFRPFSWLFRAGRPRPPARRPQLPPRRVIESPVSESVPEEVEPPKEPVSELSWQDEVPAMHGDAEKELNKILPASRGAAANESLSPSANPEEIFGSIQQLCELPTLSSLARAFKHWSSQTETDLEEFSNVVRTDPALVSEILKVSRSAYYSLDTEQLSIEDCIAYLGIVHVRMMATSIAARTSLSGWNHHYNWKPLWMHSYAVAVVSEDLRRAFRIRQIPDLHTAALLHDIGKVILSYLFPGRYRAILVQTLATKRPLTELERSEFPIDHEEVGAIYAHRHRFPASIVEAIRYHDDPSSAIENPEMIALIQVANYACQAMGLGYSGSQNGVNMDFWDSDGWNILTAKQTKTAAEMTPETIQARLLKRSELWKAELRRLFRD